MISSLWIALRSSINCATVKALNGRFRPPKRRIEVRRDSEARKQRGGDEEKKGAEEAGCKHEDVEVELAGGAIRSRLPPSATHSNSVSSTRRGLEEVALRALVSLGETKGTCDIDVVGIVLDVVVAAAVKGGAGDIARPLVSVCAKLCPFEAEVKQVR